MTLSATRTYLYKCPIDRTHHVTSYLDGFPLVLFTWTLYYVMVSCSIFSYKCISLQIYIFNIFVKTFQIAAEYNIWNISTSVVNINIRLGYLHNIIIQLLGKIVFIEISSVNSAFFTKIFFFINFVHKTQVAVHIG